MAAKGPARASLRYAKAPLSPRYQWELHQLLGHCFSRSTLAFANSPETAALMSIAASVVLQRTTDWIGHLAMFIKPSQYTLD